MTQDLRVALKITADAGGFRAEMADAKKAVEDLGQAGKKAADGLKPALTPPAPIPANVPDGFRKMGDAAAEAGRQVGITSNQMRQLAPQLNDIATQLLMGQSPFMILASQGGQITQIFGGVRATLGAIVGALTPIGVAAVGAAAGIGGVVVMLDRQQSALLGLQQRLRATRDDYQSLGSTVKSAADQLAESTSLSTGDARSAGLAIAGNRNFTGDQAELARLVRLSSDLATVMGTDVPAAAQRFVAKAIADPAAAAREAAAGGIAGFNDALRRQIELLVASGDRAAATRLVIEQYDRVARGAADEVGFLARAWDTVGQNITRAYNALDRFLERQLTGSRSSAPVAGPTNGAAMTQQLLEQREADLARFNRETAGYRDQNAETSIPGFGFGAPNALRAQMERDIAELRKQLEAVPAMVRDMTRELAALTKESRPSEVRAAVEAEARRLNIPPEFAARIAQRESGFRQTDAQGNILTSSAGALGVMQLMPGTARELGIDPTDIRQNITGGLRYIRQLLNDPRFGGDLSVVAGAYNAGPGRMARVLAGQATLPAETMAYMSAVGGGGRLAGAADTVGAAERQLAGRNTQSDLIRQREAEAGVLERAIAVPNLDPEAVQRYREALEKVRAELVGLRDPIAEANRRAGEQAGLYSHTAGAARELAAAELEAKQAAERAGKSPADALVAGLDARATAQQRLSGQLDDTIATMQRQTAAERAATAVTGQGVAAVREAEAREWARTEALRYGVQGTDAYRAAVERLTEARKQALGVGDDATIRRDLIPEQERQLAELERRAAAIGRDPATAAREAAEARARDTLTARRIPADSQAAADFITGAGRVADRDREVQRLQAAYEETGRIGERVFDGVGRSITDGIVRGEFKLKDFGRVGLAVASELSQAFLKLAIINPAKNALGLGGGNSPTLTDVVGRLFGGGNGTATPSTEWNGGVGLGAIQVETLAPIFHAGGIIGHDAAPTRSVPAALFSNAPRHHVGMNLGSDEQATILQKGEGVFTEAQMARLGPAGGDRVFAPVINFQGDAGSAEDRNKLVAMMEAVAQRTVLAHAPGIVGAARQSLVGDVRRRGMDRVFG